MFAFVSDYLGLELMDAVLEHIGWVGGDAGDIVSMQQVSSRRLPFTVIGVGEENGFLASSSREAVFFYSVIIQRPEYSGEFLSSLGSLLCIDLVTAWIFPATRYLREKDGTFSMYEETVQNFYSAHFFFCTTFREMWSFCFMTFL